MHVVDAHCDTLFAILNNKKEPQVSYDKLRQLNIPYLQFFAVFMPPSVLKNEDGFSKSQKDIEDMFTIYNNFLKDGLYRGILNRSDLDAFVNTGLEQDRKLFSLLSFEGIYLSKGDLSYIDYLYDKGVRCLSFTWNPANEFAQGMTGDSSKGLSSLGKKAVSKCNDLGILIDVSHTNDLSFYDICEHSKKPIIASHSNSRNVTSSMRNLDDNMLKTLKANNGVTCINYYDRFLRNDEEKATAADIVNHIEYICGLIGVDHVGFGSDFDGVDKTAIEDVLETFDIIDMLLKLNYSEDDVKKIAALNVVRVLREALND